MHARFAITYSWDKEKFPGHTCSDETLDLELQTAPKNGDTIYMVIHGIQWNGVIGLVHHIVYSPMIKFNNKIDHLPMYYVALTAAGKAN